MKLRALCLGEYLRDKKKQVVSCQLCLKINIYANQWVLVESLGGSVPIFCHSEFIMTGNEYIKRLGKTYRTGKWQSISEKLGKEGEREMKKTSFS